MDIGNVGSEGGYIFSGSFCIFRSREVGGGVWV